MLKNTTPVDTTLRPHLPPLTPVPAVAMAMVIVLVALPFGSLHYTTLAIVHRAYVHNVYSIHLFFLFGSFFLPLQLLSLTLAIYIRSGEEREGKGRVSEVK